MAASENLEVKGFHSSQDGRFLLDHQSEREGSPFEGVEGSTVPGYTGAIGGDSSPIPSRGEPKTAVAIAYETPGIPQNPTEEVPPSSYLERVAKPLTFEANSDSKLFSKKCGLWALLGQCENGHRFAKRLYCGKQWCEECREPTHNRKIARVLPRAQQMKPVGYWVVRPPNQLQPLLKSRLARRRFVKRIKDAFRAIGYARGLTFIHDFGEQSTKYAFHLNVLVDGGWLEPQDLDELKRKLRRLIYSKRVVDRWGDKLDINYHYRNTRAEIIHTLKYCTKATFLDIEWDEPLASNLHGERYCGWWGRWDEPAKWQLPESARKLQSLVSLEQGKCPQCGSPIQWNKRVVPLVLVLAEGGTEITAGYYELPEIRPPPAAPVRPTNLIELPDGDYRKHPNAVRRLIDRARERVSFISDYESCS
ncbi:hypothetical protein ES703_121250 [subsurface metagenome]